MNEPIIFMISCLASYTILVLIEGLSRKRKMKKLIGKKFIVNEHGKLEMID